MIIMHQDLKRTKQGSVVSRGGFTLVELMVSISISLIILTSVCSTFIIFARGSVSVGNYAAMSTESRKAMELFSRDIRGAESVSVVNPQILDGEVYTDSGLSFSYPDHFGVRSVTYRYASGGLTRSEVYAGTTKTDEILSGVNQFKITFFETPGDDFIAVSGPLASVDDWAKSLQLDAELLRTVVTTDNTDYIISARFMMRNVN